MAANLSPRDPSEARHILEVFVDETNHAEEIQSYDQLKSIVTPQITGAIVDLITLTGRPPKSPRAPAMAILEDTSGRTRYRGMVTPSSYPDHKYISLEERHRRPVTFKWKRLLQVDSSGVNMNSAAHDGDEMYMPSQASDEFQSFFAEIGGQTIQSGNRITTGYSVASEAALRAPADLNGFLRVSSQLVAGLLQIEPAH